MAEKAPPDKAKIPLGLLVSLCETATAQIEDLRRGTAAAELISSSLITYYRKRQNGFHFAVYVAPGVCREAAVFLSHPFASAGGGYSKRQKLSSFTIAFSC